MREKSIKWMIGTLIFFALIILGFSLIFSKKETQPESTPVPTQEIIPTVSPASETTPVITPSPSPTPSATPEPEVKTPTPSPTQEELEANEKLRAYISKMSMRDKLGQLVMFGFSGTQSVNLDFRNVVGKYHIGNVVLYGDNINDHLEDGGFSRAKFLTKKLETYNRTKIPFLISIDIEGGSVRRFKWDRSLLSARNLGKHNDPEEAYDQFYLIGTKLRETGINMNLAPVLDISENAKKTFLGTRIISGDPQIASNIGTAIVSGLNDAHCLSTAKHFPGHGGTVADSHSTTPVVKKTKEEMLNYDLIPFASAIRAGVDTVLVAHISYPGLDPDDIASMSSTVITGLLRDELGHTGIVMSDDFRMGGLKSRYTVSEAAVRFIQAGGDLILCGPRNDLQIQIMDSLTQAAEDGTLSEERIDESVFRILKKKMKVSSWTPDI